MAVFKLGPMVSEVTTLPTGPPPRTVHPSWNFFLLLFSLKIFILKAIPQIVPLHLEIFFFISASDEYLKDT